MKRLMGYISLEEITITLAICSLLCLKGVTVDFTGSSVSPTLQSVLRPFMPRIKIEIYFIRMFDINTSFFFVV